MIAKKNNLPELLKGWMWTTIEDILLTLESGSRPKGGVRNIKEGIPSIGGEHLLYSGRFGFTKIRYIPREFYEKMTRGKIQKKDVLVVKDGATTGKTAFVSDSFPFSKAAVNEHVFILRVLGEYCNSKYLFFWMQSIYGQNCVRDNFQGTAQGGINSYFVKNSNFPLSPLPEQHRVVAKIEELFTKLDAGVEELKKIKVQLKRYRQVVLKSAIEGKLTAKWRETYEDELEPETVLLERMKEEWKKNAKGKYKELPHGWVWTSFDIACDKIQDGSHYSPKIQYKTPREGRYLYITAKNIKENGIDLSNVTYVDYAFHKSIYNRCNPEKGDVLLIKDGIKTGVATINNISEEFSLLSSVAVLKPNKNILSSHYLKYFLNSPVGFTMITEKMTGTAIKRIILDKIRSSYLPFPPLPEQHKIVKEIEQRLSVADKVGKVTEQSLKQAERLRQSILKKAFEGKLVPQDPTDEPASVLLERIKAEKAKRQTEGEMKKKRKRKINTKQRS